MDDNEHKESPLLIGVREVAHLLGAGESTVRKWSSGHLPPPAGFPPFLKLGARVVVRRRDLEAWVASLGIPPQADLQRPRRGRPRKQWPSTGP
ncbi:helix-turn-helix transcriptional regulator [Pelomicrobium sp.]|jgi:predicted DNA-binding transcriptional regulator AlpA|uniref:helix-turn-helix transcriptional regulator n=1 Tax=Pelomicrobium sp. TaxID=2815319 RepID=UPI003FA7AB64